MSKRRRKTPSPGSDAVNQVPTVDSFWPESESAAGTDVVAETRLTVEVAPALASRLSVHPTEPSDPAGHPSAGSESPAMAPDALRAAETDLVAADALLVVPAAAVSPASATDPVLELSTAVASPADPSAAPATFPRESVIEVQPSLGARLRAAREVRGISREDMARRLRVSPTVVSDLESENWLRLGASVYVRGHLKNYARMVDIPQVAVAHAVKRIGEAVPLLPSLPAASAASWSARNRHASTYLVYALLTLMLAVPTYTMLNNRGINSPEPLVASPAPQVAAGAGAEDSTAGEPVPTLPGLPPAGPSVVSPVDPSALPGPNAGAESSGPMMASMAPMVEAAPSSSALASPARVAGQHQLLLTFSDRSWVELLDADGRRLEYGILDAGVSRQYRVGGPVSLHVGNASAVTLSVDGERVDLGAHARQNVARLKLFEATSEIPAATR
ncbi:MAG: helix-turn-helix domain-containing protein [Lysobacterales bacterium]